MEAANLNLHTTPPLIPQLEACARLNRRLDLGLRIFWSKGEVMKLVHTAAILVCPKKRSLLEKYDVLVRTYLDAVVRMHQGADLPLSEFTVLYDLAMGANDLCQSAEDSVRSHMEEHGC